MTAHVAARRARQTTLALVAVLALAWLIGSVIYRDTLWWWGPGRTHVLGRDYDRSGSVTRARISSEAPGPIHVVGHLPLGQSILAVDASSSAYVPTVVYLHEWDGQYVAYSLSGGP